MTEAYSTRYFVWLCMQINIEVNGDQQYTQVLQRLHWKPFVEIIPNDENRVVDARDVRHEFWDGGYEPDLPISVLEVLIALSRRCEFNGGGEASRWAWTLLKNLKLHRYPDPLSEVRRRHVDEIIDRLVSREYDADGTGGFFPLRHLAVQDQREVEIWYQMSTYINERS